MGDAIDIRLQEFEQLRHEVVSRIGLAYALIGLNLTVIGAGVTVFQRFPEVVLGLALASSFLWLIFLDHASQVYKIAAYIALRLAPQLRDVAPGALGWESFLRELDHSPQSAGRALYGADATTFPRRWIRAGGPSPYLAALFGGSPPLLILIFLVSADLGTAGDDVVRLAVTGAVVAVWAVAVRRYRDFRHTVAVINAAVSADRTTAA